MKRFVISLILTGALLVACSSHKDFPSMISLVTSPQPGNFTVSTVDYINYDLSWTISDDSNLRFYVLYSVDVATGVPVPFDTTLATSAAVNTFVPTPTIVFGVSSVSTGNVESSVSYATALP